MSRRLAEMRTKLWRGFLLRDWFDARGKIDIRPNQIVRVSGDAMRGFTLRSESFRVGEASTDLAV